MQFTAQSTSVSLDHAQVLDSICFGVSVPQQGLNQIYYGGD